ncbi:MAG: hypothetical protein KAT27_11710 [Desulfobacterales bacterium]|nr:hypothetical protein [Desulfobacterales bacterium]
MESGLSVESQFSTIFMVILAPVLGALADAFSVGTALGCLGGAMLLVSVFVRVKAKV